MKEAMKKKIIIFTSTGGGGHLSVSNALIEGLADEYQVVPSLILGEILKPIDPVRTASLGYLNFEGLYNILLKKGWYRNSTTNAGLLYFNSRSAKIKHLITAYLRKESPDLILSVVPLFNGYILQAAQELNIPFILVPTDLDATTFIRTIVHPTFSQFRVAISFDHGTINQKLLPNKIQANQLSLTGFPLKKSFSEPKNRDEIKKKFNIRQDKPVIMILMGAQGSKTTLSFAQELADFDRPAHLLFCVGKNEAIKDSIEKMTFAPRLSVSCIGFTPAIADLMSAADLIITKSGTVSVCEAIYMNLPLILDATHALLSWEKLNHQFIEDMGFGLSLTHRHELKDILTKFLEVGQLAAIKKRLQHFGKKNGVQQIKNLIGELLGPELINPGIATTQERQLS